VIQISGEASIIESTQTSGGVMNNQSLIQLPINGPDYARFSLLIPGAVARSDFIADLSFNGLYSVHNQFRIDGAFLNVVVFRFRTFLVMDRRSI
jgi:hypothetical protein